MSTQDFSHISLTDRLSLINDLMPLMGKIFYFVCNGKFRQCQEKEREELIKQLLPIIKIIYSRPHPEEYSTGIINLGYIEEE